MNMVQHPDTKEVGWRHNLDAIQTAFESDIRTFPAMEADITYHGPTLFVGGSESEYIPVSTIRKSLRGFLALTSSTSKGLAIGFMLKSQRSSSI